jgi:hypothetical protein
VHGGVKGNEEKAESAMAAGAQKAERSVALRMSMKLVPFLLLIYLPYSSIFLCHYSI